MKRLKKFLYTFIALFILFPCLTNAATELSAATQNPTVGSYVYVQLEANYGDTLKIRDFHVYIDYDPTYFSLENVIWVKLGADSGTSRVENGRVYIDKSYGNWSSGPIAQLKLKVLKEGFTELNVGHNGESYYTNGDVIAQTMAGIYINAQKPSDDTLIGSLYVENYTIQPTFSRTDYNYNLTVPSNVTSVNVVATKGDKKQTITGTGRRQLEYGANRVRVVVTAQNKSTRTYEIMITRTDNRTGDTSLKSLSVSNTPIKYEKNKNVYEATVSKSVDSVMLTGRTTDPNATLIGTGQKKLKVGLNSFTLTVKSSGGKEQKYTINIIRSNEELQTIKKSSKLLNLKINNLVLDLSGDKKTFLYGIGKEYSQLSIDTVSESATATTQITGNEKLEPGINLITITVTEKLDAETEDKTEYKVIVYKNPTTATVINNFNSVSGTKDFLYSTTSTSSTKIPLSLINNLKTNNTKLYYNIVNMSNGLLYQFVFQNNLPDTEIDAYITKVNDSPLTYQVNLPKDTEITAYVEESYASGTDVKIYSYDEANNYTLITDGVQVQNGYVTFNTNGQKNYIITTADLIKEQSEFDKLISKYKGIIISVIIVFIVIIAICIIVNKKIKQKETNEPLY